MDSWLAILEPVDSFSMLEMSVSVLSTDGGVVVELFHFVKLQCRNTAATI